MVGHVNRKPHVFEYAAGQELEAPEPQIALGGVVGEIAGTAVIRDADGNVKGEITFGGPTDLTLDEFKEAMGLNQEKQEEVDSNGGDSDNDGA
jgi:hypothetical protein